MLGATYQTRALKLNARGKLQDVCPKVECSRHIGRVPTLARLEITGLFDSPVNDRLLLVSLVKTEQKYLLNNDALLQSPKTLTRHHCLIDISAQFSPRKIPLILTH